MLDVTNAQYSPGDDLGKQLLASIPKKVFNWLNNMRVDMLAPGDFNQLSWQFSEQGGIIAFNAADSCFQLAWKGDPNSPSVVSGSDARFGSISQNLDFFVEVEKSIYDELEKLQGNLDNVRDNSKSSI